MTQTNGDAERHYIHKDEIIKTLEKDTYAKHLGIELIELGEGSAVAELKVKDHMLNAHGTLHGAVTYAIADFAFAAACNSYGRTTVGLSTTMNYMAAGYNNSTIKAIAIEEKKNHKTAWYKIKIETNGELLATMEALAYRKDHYFITNK